MGVCGKYIFKMGVCGNSEYIIRNVFVPYIHSLEYSQAVDARNAPKNSLSEMFGNTKECFWEKYFC